MYRSVLMAGALIAMGVLGGCAGTARPVVEQPVETVSELPAYSDSDYRLLVKKYSMNGGESVDYGAWKASKDDMDALDRHIELIARVSPNSHPELFAGKASRRSYWINSYNALVLQAVLEYWPLESVRDVKISFSSRIVPGKGFFYDREVVVGGKRTNLFRLEKEVLASQKDPRLHFALNCASDSCPVLRPWEWTDEQLDRAARDFVNSPENVAVEEGELVVSRIFKWYKKDFPADLNGYLQQFAEPELVAQLQQAERDGFRTVYRAYDWAVNADGHSDQSP